MQVLSTHIWQKDMRFRGCYQVCWAVPGVKKGLGKLWTEPPAWDFLGSACTTYSQGGWAGAIYLLISY